MSLNVQLRDAQSHARIGGYTVGDLPGGVDVYLTGGVRVAYISSQVTPYTGEGDSGELTTNTITGVSDSYQLAGAVRDFTEAWGDSTGGGGSRTGTETLSAGSNYTFIHDDYQWHNSTLQQSGWHTMGTTLLVLYVSVPSPGTVVVSTRSEPAAGGTTSPVRKEISVLPGTRWSVGLTALPNAGYVFVGWYLSGTQISQSLMYTYHGDGTAASTYSFTAVFRARTSPSDPPAPGAPYAPGHGPGGDPDLSYIVVYVGCDPEDVARASIGSDPEAGVTAQTYTNFPGTSVVVQCSASRISPDHDDYVFYRWVSDGDVGAFQSTSSADGSRGNLRVVLDFPAAGKVKVVCLTAEFKSERRLKVTTVASPRGSGVTCGDGEYESGETCNVMAFNGGNSRFLWWEDAKFPGQRLSRQAAYEFTVRDDIDLVAVYHVFTGLILRSRNSGIIFRNASGKIVRDGDP